MQRGLSNKPSSTQKFIPFKSQQEEKPKNVFFDLISSKTSAVQAPKVRTLSLDVDMSSDRFYNFDL